MRKIVVLLLNAMCMLSYTLDATLASENVTVTSYSGKLYVHMMPWFETKTSSGNGKWGIHWTMNNQNPDLIDKTGRRSIASFNYPQIGPYASADPNVIEYQLLLMKYSGIDGVLIDWPGALNQLDYQKNRENAEAIIAGTQKFGLGFAVVYEDHNLGLVNNPPVDKLQQGKLDMIYLRDKYFTKPNYIKTNGQPLLLDFGPQTLTTPNDWKQVFSVFSQKPTFLTLWYQKDQAQGSSSGEFAWIYKDGFPGLQNFYANRPLGVKYGVCYPGFKTFYKNGGWGEIDWTLPFGDTFTRSFDLAASAGNVNAIQIATWNDYGEGTMIEPTREFGTTFLEAIQKRRVQFTVKELNMISNLFEKRVKFAGNQDKQAKLDQVSSLLNQLKPNDAATLLATI